MRKRRFRDPSALLPCHMVPAQTNVRKARKPSRKVRGLSAKPVFSSPYLRRQFKESWGCSGLLFGDFACLSAHSEVGLFALNRLNNPYTTQAAAVG